jgi:hypothetical protein
MKAFIVATTLLLTSVCFSQIHTPPIYEGQDVENEEEEQFLKLLKRDKVETDGTESWNGVQDEERNPVYIRSNRS